MPPCFQKTIWGTIYSPNSFSPLRRGWQIDFISLTDGQQWMPRRGDDMNSTTRPGTEERSAARSECRLERRMAQMLQMPHPWLEGMQRSPRSPFCGCAASQMLCFKLLPAARWLTAKARTLPLQLPVPQQAESRLNLET